MFTLRQIMSVVLFLMSSVIYATTPSNTEVEIVSIPTDISTEWQICDARAAKLGLSTQNCRAITPVAIDQLSPESFVLLQLKLRLDETIKSSYLGIVIKEIHGADELYVNGHLIGKTGNFPPYYENASHYPRYYFIPPHLLHHNQPNLLQLKLYHHNFYDWLTSISSEVVDYNRLALDRQSTDVFFTSITVLLIFMSLVKFYHFIRIPGKFSPLALGAFFVCSGITVLLQNQYILSLGFDMNSILRWQVLFFVFSQLALLYFLLITFDLNITFYRRFILSFYILFGILVLVWPFAETLSLFYFSSQISAIAMPVFMLGSTLVVRRERKNPLQRIVLLAFLLYIILMTLELFRPLWQDVVNIQYGLLQLVAIVQLSLLAFFISIENYWLFFKGSTYDHLTGTLLRPAFIKRLSEEMQRCRRSEYQLMLAIIDLDQFKSINQNYGHSVGDKALIIMSATLTRALRQFDLICRLDDDEFCIAATLPANSNIEAFLQRLHEEVNTATIAITNDQKLNLQATTGAVIFDEDRHEAPEMLLHDAEHSLTEAKMKQRGSIQWFDTNNPPLQFIF